MTTKKFSGAELEKALETGLGSETNNDIANNHIVCMVKTSSNANFVSLSFSGCDDWFDFPTSLIDSAEHIGKSNCKDHVHSIMRIELCSAADEHAKALMILISKLAVRSIPEPPKGGATQPNSPVDSGAQFFRGFGFGRPGGFGGFGDLSPTLPTCYWVKRWVVCGSAFPGYDPPMCLDWVYCCRYANGSEGCM